LNLDQDKKVILNFGAMRPYKGIESLLEAVSLLCRGHSDVLLLLAGKPMNVPYAYFEQLISQYGLDENVILRPDYIPAGDVPDIFFASDLVVLPYKHIDTSGSIQTAYAFSKPVVATRTGSMAEVLDHNVNGLLVPPDDPQALAGAIEKVLFDPQALQRMGEASMALAIGKFSWQSIAQKTCQLYFEVAK
jgi:D-inositol-3-phosphate glycosyltransferase